MDSNNKNSPMFLVFPPEVTSPEQQTTLRASAYNAQNRVQKVLIRKLKVLGVSKMCPYVYSIQGGVGKNYPSTHSSTRMNSSFHFHSNYEVSTVLLYKLCTRFCEQENTR